jgi:HAD superfamily hydrolase (TIGR01662 family)
MDAEDVEKIHSSMIRQVEGARGRIDLVLYSPHLESEGSEMRKPAIGMALEAQRIFPEIDFNKSVMVGDTESDMVFGRSAGMITVLIKENPDGKIKPDFFFTDLLTFAGSI